MIKCWVCLDKGHAINKQDVADDKSNYIMTYSYAMHCDCCTKGNEYKSDYTDKFGNRYYTDGISKIFGREEIIKYNKSIYKHAEESEKVDKNIIASKFKNNFCI